jgi:hypothetical protein
MGRPAKKSIAHPLLMALHEAQGRCDVLVRRLDTENRIRHQAIREALAAGLTQGDCARAMGCSRAHISRIVKVYNLGAQVETPPELGEDCHACGQPGWLVRTHEGGRQELLCTPCARAPRVA